MNFTSMDYFVALAEEKSFTRAAARLAVTQQTLSAHIAGVERELGVRLVNRRVPLTLTYAGQVFLGYAQRFRSQERAMRQEFLDIAGDQRGLLGVGVASTRGHMLMPQAISSFGASHPGVNVLLHEDENEALVSLLRAEKLDMVVATVPHDAHDLEVHRLYREQVVLLAHQDLLARALGEDVEGVLGRVGRTGDMRLLARLPFMMLGENDEPGDLARRMFASSGVEPTVRVYSKNSETLVDLAAEGVGACFVPFELAVDSIKKHGRDRLRMIGLGKRAMIDIDVAWRRSDHVWSVVKDFNDVLVELFCPLPHTIQEERERLTARGGEK
ncbi:MULTISPECIES: LysR family transcriptional regulator [Atopobiaceae]|uniref:DNA-binding transcriptional regulator, LysR family n=1 Tax=Parafannyhessea umbonata TaxID=604330 RepID=A0A1H6HSL1_9ACTN|nr:MULTISPECIES: LysR family transcriptional regulator [Atopobiaceae]SEH37120.1 DNA-binding transcriptional regulator, LysR family [Parafannyhessea umbonata]SJZ39144.1 DNA-binding transcriptional regulator, LysR family [Olsenella sp. KH1P3]